MRGMIRDPGLRQQPGETEARICGMGCSRDRPQPRGNSLCGAGRRVGEASADL